MKIARPGIMAAALAITLLVGVAGISLARGGMFYGDQYGYGPQRGYFAPELSQEQLVAAEKHQAEFRAATEATRKQLIMKEAELQAELSGGSYDQAKVVSLSKEIGELEGRLFSANLEMRNKLEAEGITGYRNAPCFTGGGYNNYGNCGYSRGGGYNNYGNCGYSRGGWGRHHMGRYM